MPNNNTPKKKHAFTVGVALLLLGLALFTMFHYYIEEEQYNAESERRWNYIQEKYPPGTYRGPEVSEYLFRPYPIPPARGVKTSAYY